MNKYQKTLIDKYLNGTLTGDELAEVRQLVVEDEAFNERFEVRKALKEIEELQTNVNNEGELDRWLINRQDKRHQKRQRNFAFVVAACLVLLVGVGVFLFDYFKQSSVETFDANYYEVNFYGGLGAISSISGSMVQSKPALAGKTKLILIQDNRLRQQDTTYRLYGTDSLFIRLPKNEKNTQKQNFSLLYDYKIFTTFLIITKDTFVVDENLKYEKLLKYKK